MDNFAGIVDYATMRGGHGIDDAVLRKGIRGLRVGDLVKLTLLSATESFGGETILVRISGIHAPDFHGKLASQPTSDELGRMRIGSALTFSAANIYSIPRERPGRKR